MIRQHIYVDESESLLGAPVAQWVKGRSRSTDLAVLDLSPAQGEIF